MRARASATRARSASVSDDTRRPDHVLRREPDRGEGRRHQLLALVASALDQVEGLLDHLAHLGLRGQDRVEILGDEMEAALQRLQVLAGEGGQVGPLEAHGADVGLEQTGEHPGDDALARAGGADQAHVLTRLDGDAHVPHRVDDRLLAHRERLAQAVGLEQPGGHRSADPGGDGRLPRRSPLAGPVSPATKG